MIRKSTLHGRKGQGLTEYIIIVALVAIAAIGITNIFGNQLRNQFATIIAAMSGSSVANVASLKDDADTETNKKTLSNYAATKQ